MSEQYEKCDYCGKRDHTVIRGECAQCRAEDKASDMTVGDLGGR